MSMLAEARPTAVPAGPAPGRRHVEIVTTRAQRRARPRLVYVLVTVLGLFGILMAQLLLSIVLSDNAYQLSSWQAKQKELTRTQQMLSEQLDVLNSPQNLAQRAEALGMVSNASPAFLRLSDGAVLGAPVAAKASTGGVVDAATGNLVANSLLPFYTEAAATGSATDAAAGGQTPGASAADAPVAGTAAPGAAETGDSGSGALGEGTGVAAQPPATGSVASTGGMLPAPITR